MMKYHLSPTSAPVPLIGLMAVVLGLFASEPVLTRLAPRHSRRVESATPPAAPGGLLAAAVSSSQISLSWTDTGTAESSFKIERAPSASGAWVQIATTATNVSTYSNTGLSASTTYYYRVRASNTAGNSAYTNTASAKTLSASTGSPPLAPSNL